VGTAADEPVGTDDPEPADEEPAEEQTDDEPAGEEMAAAEPAAEEPTAEGAVSEEAATVPASDEPGVEPPADPEPVTDEAEAAPEAGEPAVPGESEALAPEPAEPGTADPTVAVAAAPLVDPVAPDAVEDVPVEEQPAAATTPADAEAAEDGDVPSTRPAQALLAALVATVVLLAALTGFLAWMSHDTSGGGDVAKARVDALAASRGAARVVFSYDYRHLQKDFAAGKALITGQFAQEYARTTGKIVDDVAGRYKAIVAADVTDAAVVRASSDQVVTLLFLTQQSTSTLSASTKITQSRLEMTMVHRHGRWLVSKIRAF
jgi:Mce-associated membrane protein